MHTYRYAHTQTHPQIYAWIGISGWNSPMLVTFSIVNFCLIIKKHKHKQHRPPPHPPPPLLLKQHIPTNQTIRYWKNSNRHWLFQKRNIHLKRQPISALLSFERVKCVFGDQKTGCSLLYNGISYTTPFRCFGAPTCLRKQGLLLL